MLSNTTCEYCQLSSEYICRCNAEFCENHSTHHASLCQNTIVKKSTDSKLKNTRSQRLSQRILKIKNLTTQIISKTQAIIAKIENLCSISISKLENLAKSYTSILHSEDQSAIEAELRRADIEFFFSEPNLEQIKISILKLFAKKLS